MRIRQATTHDLPAIVAIYNDAIRSTVATFDLDEVSVEERRPWLAQFGGEHPLYVAEDAAGSAVLGFAYYLPYRTRAGYAATKETTVYVAREARRQNVGSKLYEALIDYARTRAVHVLVAVLGGDNPESRGLHEKLGFVHAGHLREVGRKFGQWVDTDYYLLHLS